MKLLGLNPTVQTAQHDSSLATYDNGKVEYLKIERLIGVKHATCPLNLMLKLAKIKPDYVCYSMAAWEPPQFRKIGRKHLVERHRIRKIPAYFIDHHYAHMLSAWPLIDLKDVDVGVVFDGCGNRDRRATAFRRKGQGFKVVGTQVGLKRSVGYWFTSVCGEMLGYGGGLDGAGKVMGAQAYGEVDWEFLKTAKKELKLDCSTYQFEDPVFRNWLATRHKLVESIVLDFFAQHCKPHDTIVYGGGCALNTVFNEALHQIYPNLIVLPHAYDGGISLGCLEYLRQRCKLPEMKKEGFPYWQQDIELEIPSDETIQKVAQMLANGEIVGWFQGRGEIGPRALGNRSILMNPTIKDGKKILNDKVKHREYWRPYAPAVLLEHSKDWFEIDESSPYMLRAVQTKKDKQHLIPAVVHVDGTSRIQTVSKENNELFYKLISAFHKITGIPLVLNTSFNKAGQPIYATRKQCIEMLDDTGLDAICLGNTLQTKKLRQKKPRPEKLRFL
jgi:carbamoyltransferase